LTLYDFTTFKWSAPTSFTNYVTVLLLLVGFVAAEINPFYLKASTAWLPQVTTGFADSLTARASC
jgi:hypothetical protein